MAFLLSASAITTARAQDVLPPEVQFDVLKLEIAEASRRDRHKDVLSMAERMRKTGQPVPADISFLEGKAFYGLGALAMSRRALATYLKDAGRAGKDYDEALRLFVRVKTEIDDRARTARETSRLRSDFEAARAIWQQERERAALWKKHAIVFGGPEDDSAAAMARTDDGGIVLAGALHVRKTQDDKTINATLPWITAFNGNGKRIWHRPLGAASDPGSLRSVTVLPGKGFLFGGAQKNFQIAALTDRQGNLVANGEGDPWIMAFAPSSGEGGIARLLNNGDIIAIGTQEIGKGDDSGRATARLPIAVRLSPKGKVVGRFVLARAGGARWYDVKDALVLDGGDVVIAGESRAIDGDASSAEGYLIRFKTSGEEIWSRRVPPSRGGGGAITALAGNGGSIYAVGRDGAELSYMKYDGGGQLLWKRSRAAPAMPESFTRLCAVADLPARLTVAYSKTKAPAGDPLSNLGEVRAFACRSGKGFAAATAIVPREGGFLILGIIGRDGDPATRITATAIDADGKAIWETQHGDGPINVATGGLPTGDGGFVIGGITNNWGRDVLLFKLTAKGELTSFAAIAPRAVPAKPKKQAAPPEKKAEPPKPSDSEDPPEAEKTEPSPEAPAPERSESKAPPPARKPAPSGEASYDLLDLLDGLFGGNPAPGSKDERP
jgi:outer membrane protein assembly factor BamB